MNIQYPIETRLILAVLDIDEFWKLNKDLEPQANFELLNSYYEMVGRLVSETGGETIKVMGDAILIVYPSDHPRPMVGTLRNLVLRTQELLQEAGYTCSVTLRAHIGNAYLGYLGPVHRKCLDVVGNSVNQLFALSGRGFILSPELEKLMES